MTLEYYREYRTYFHIGASYKISESSEYETIKFVEESLINSKKHFKKLMALRIILIVLSFSPFLVKYISETYFNIEDIVRNSIKAPSEKYELEFEKNYNTILGLTKFENIEKPYNLSNFCQNEDVIEYLEFTNGIYDSDNNFLIWNKDEDVYYIVRFENDNCIVSNYYNKKTNVTFSKSVVVR